MMPQYRISTVVKSTLCDYPFYRHYIPFSRPVLRYIEDDENTIVEVLRIKPERIAPIFDRYEWYIVFKYFIYDKTNYHFVRDAFLIDEAYLIIQDRTGVGQPKKISIKHDEDYIGILKARSGADFVSSLLDDIKNNDFELLLVFSGCNNYLVLYVSVRYKYIAKGVPLDSDQVWKTYSNYCKIFNTRFIWHFDEIIHEDRDSSISMQYKYDDSHLLKIYKGDVSDLLVRLNILLRRVVSQSDTRQLVLKTDKNTSHHVIAIDKSYMALGLELKPTDVDKDFMPSERMFGRNLPDYSMSAIDWNTLNELSRRRRKKGINYDIHIETYNDKTHIIEYSKPLGIMKLYEWTGERFVEKQDLSWFIKNEIKVKKDIDIRRVDVLNDKYIYLHDANSGEWLFELSGRSGEILNTILVQAYVRLHDGTVFLFDKSNKKVHVFGRLGHVVISVEAKYSLIYGFYEPTTQKLAIIGRLGRRLIAYRRYHIKNNELSLEKQINLEKCDNSLLHINSINSTLVICSDNARKRSVFFVFDINGLSYKFTTDMAVSSIGKTWAGHHILTLLKSEIENVSKSQFLCIYKNNRKYDHIIVPPNVVSKVYDKECYVLEYDQSIRIYFDVIEKIAVKMYNDRRNNVGEEIIITDNYFTTFDAYPLYIYSIKYLPFCYRFIKAIYASTENTNYRMLITVNHDDTQYIIFDRLKPQKVYAYYSLYFKSVIINKSFSEVFLATPYNRYYIA